MCVLFNDNYTEAEFELISRTILTFFFFKCAKSRDRLNEVVHVILLVNDFTVVYVMAISIPLLWPKESCPLHPNSCSLNKEE